MPFSQQTYTGQGIVQPTERSRVGEFLGAGLAGLGAGIGEGIKKFRQDKEEAKELRANLKLFRKTIPEEEREAFDATIEAGSLADLKGLKRGILEMGALELQELQKQEAEEALAAKKFARQTAVEEGKMYSEFMGMMQPQEVEEQVDFTGQVGRAQSAYEAALQRQYGDKPQIFRPKAFVDPQYMTDERVMRDPESYVTPSGLSYGFGGAFYRPPQPARPTPSATAQQQQEMRAMRQSGLPMGPSPAPEPELAGPAVPEPASQEVVDAAKQLALLEAQQAKGETVTRTETAQEVMSRVSQNIPELVEKYPTQAKNLYDTLYPKQDKLTPSEQISLMKLEREIGASTVTGYGVAPSPEIAKEFREVLISATEAQTGIKRLLEINEMDSPWTSLDLRSEAGVLQGTLQGALRREIVGPGAVTESEQKLLKSIIRDPTKFWSLSSSNKTALETLLKKVERGLAKNAEVISWQQTAGTQAGQAQRPMGRTVSYGMSGRPVMQ
jgi:hypothetical protein